MKKIPTDLQILQTIFDDYYPAFSLANPDETGIRRSPFVPIDIRAIAEKFAADPDIIFGRLYYHLSHKYAYDKVVLFADQVGGKTDAINLPYLASILSGMQTEDRRQRWALNVSIVSVVISALSFIMALVAIVISKAG